jgi:hypothetical protein
LDLVHPLEARQEQPLFGRVTYRPDLFGRRIRSMADFLAQVDQDHPVLSEMVRSGTIVDTQMYFDYFYHSEQLYSEDGWFLVGDTARAVDPLYSNGISMTTFQVGQIAEIIERQRDGTLQAGDVAALDEIGRWIMERAQREVTEQYEIMHDSFQACMQRYFNVTGWFNGVLPLWWNGFLTTPEGARLLLRLFRGRDADAESLWALAAEAAAAIGPPYDQQGFDLGPDLDWVLNPRFDCAREDVMKAVARMFARRRYIRRRLLAMNGYKHLGREFPDWPAKPSAHCCCVCCRCCGRRNLPRRGHRSLTSTCGGPDRSGTCPSRKFLMAARWFNTEQRHQAPSHLARHTRFEIGRNRQGAPHGAGNIAAGGCRSAPRLRRKRLR